MGKCWFCCIVVVRGDSLGAVYIRWPSILWPGGTQLSDRLHLQRKPTLAARQLSFATVSALGFLAQEARRAIAEKPRVTARHSKCFKDISELYIEMDKRKFQFWKSFHHRRRRHITRVSYFCLLFQRCDSILCTNAAQSGNLANYSVQAAAVFPSS